MSADDDDELASRAPRHCRRQFDHIIGDVLFSASSATVVRNAGVQFTVRLGDVVRGVVTTLEFGDSSSPVDNATLSADDNDGRDDPSATYRYRADVSHRYRCAGRHRAQLTVRMHAHLPYLPPDNFVPSPP